MTKLGKLVKTSETREKNNEMKFNLKRDHGREKII